MGPQKITSGLLKHLVAFALSKHELASPHGIWTGWDLVQLANFLRLVPCKKAEPRRYSERCRWNHYSFPFSLFGVFGPIDHERDGQNSSAAPFHAPMAGFATWSLGGINVAKMLHENIWMTSKSLPQHILQFGRLARGPVTRMSETVMEQLA